MFLSVPFNFLKHSFHLKHIPLPYFFIPRRQWFLIASTPDRPPYWSLILSLITYVYNAFFNIEHITWQGVQLGVEHDNGRCVMRVLPGGIKKDDSNILGNNDGEASKLARWHILYTTWINKWRRHTLRFNIYLDRSHCSIQTSTITFTPMTITIETQPRSNCEQTVFAAHVYFLHKESLLLLN